MTTTMFWFWTIANTAALPPTVTEVTPSKPEPLIVTFLPCFTEFGRNPVMVGLTIVGWLTHGTIWTPGCCDWMLVPALIRPPGREAVEKVPAFVVTMIGP